jgi:hypothetical protein
MRRRGGEESEREDNRRLARILLEVYTTIGRL